MKFNNKIIFLFLLLAMVNPNHSQQNVIIPKQTPEQEAAKQTEKLKIELNLNAEQTKQIYEINLQYARQRQISNTRTEAMERIKNKNADIERVLTEQQNAQLLNKRFEKSSNEVISTVRTQTINPPSFRSSSQIQPSNPNARIISSESNLRSNTRTSISPTQPAAAASSQGSNSAAPQAAKRSTPTMSTPQINNTQPSFRNQRTSPTPSRSEPANNSNRK